MVAEPLRKNFDSANSRKQRLRLRRPRTVRRLGWTNAGKAADQLAKGVPARFEIAELIE
jgi:hypothetical protein